MKEFLIGFFAILIVGLLIFFAPDIHRHFGTRYSDANRDIFEHNKSYIHGKIENLQRLRMEYETSENGQHREALRRMIIIESSTIKNYELPSDLDSFILGL